MRQVLESELWHVAESKLQRVPDRRSSSCLTPVRRHAQVCFPKGSARHETAAHWETDIPDSQSISQASHRYDERNVCPRSGLPHNLVPQPHQVAAQSLEVNQLDRDDVLRRGQLRRALDATRRGTSHQAGTDDHAHLIHRPGAVSGHITPVYYTFTS